MIVRIIAGAPSAYMDQVDGYIIAVDKGIEHATYKGLKIDVAVGDFDSVDHKMLEGLKKISLPIEKDETDLYVAIQHALSLQPEKIFVYGASNGRLDHYLANISLLGLGDIELIDEVNRVYVKDTGFSVSSKEYISFFHYEGSPVLSLTGFKYPLEHYSLKPNNTLCVSNELVGETGYVEVKNGKILVIESKKEA